MGVINPQCAANFSGQNSKDKEIGKEFCLDNAKIGVTEMQGVSDKFFKTIFDIIF